LPTRRKAPQQARFTFNKSKEDKIEKAFFEEFKKSRKLGKAIGV
jgi:hypothetical protein